MRQKDCLKILNERGPQTPEPEVAFTLEFLMEGVRHKS